MAVIDDLYHYYDKSPWDKRKLNQLIPPTYGAFFVNMSNVLPWNPGRQYSEIYVLDARFRDGMCSAAGRLAGSFVCGLRVWSRYEFHLRLSTESG
jgi:hypothetical protein